MNASCVGLGHVYNDPILLTILASASQFVMAFLSLKCPFLAVTARVHPLSPGNGQRLHVCSYFERWNVLVQACFSAAWRVMFRHQTHLLPCHFGEWVRSNVVYGAAHCTVTARLQGSEPLATKSLLPPAVSLTNGAAANTALKQSSKDRVQWATFSDKEGAPWYFINLCFWKLVITGTKNNVTNCWWNHKHFVQAVSTYCLSHLRIIYTLMLVLREGKLSKVSKTKCSSKIKLIF